MTGVQTCALPILLDTNHAFNLLVAPGYPELIPELVTLNDNRSDTGFVIGDTPMTLQPTATELTNWNTNSGTWAGNGLATSSAYLGVYYPAGLTTDLAGNTVAVPASHSVLRTFLYNDNVAYPWFAPAGLTRGVVTNASNVGYINGEGEFMPVALTTDRKSTRLNSSHIPLSRMPSSA